MTMEPPWGEFSGMAELQTMPSEYLHSRLATPIYDIKVIDIKDM